MTKVSIIIPAYKQADYLAKTIESALGQTHNEIEVIVVDDGSPDHTPEVAARYRDRANFKYVRQENAGLAGARNRGIIESTGAYLCFLDSDDLYLNEKVAKQALLLDRNPDVGFVYCDLTTIDEHDQPVADQFHVADLKRELSGNIFHSLLQGGYFPPHTVMIRRSVLDQVGPFDPVLGGYADYELWLRVSGAGFKTVFLPERLVLYRRHSANMSKDGQHMGETRLATLRKIARLYPDRAGEGLDRLQQALIETNVANVWMQRKLGQSPHYQNALAQNTATDAIAAQDVQMTIAWRAKLEAANAMLAANQRALAMKLLLEGVKAVEGSRNPRITLEAIVEICAKLLVLDAGRARYLLNIAVKLGENLRAGTLLDRAKQLLATLDASRPDSKAVGTAR